MAFHTKEELESVIRSANLKVTKHRLSVLFYLSRSRGPLTAHEIMDGIRKKDGIDQATIYRNLSSLKDVGIIKRSDFNHGHAHYTLSTGKATHQIICNSCGLIERIEGVSTEMPAKKILQKSKSFKKAKTHSIEIYGLCKNCT